ncbi:SETD7 [Lepeophtheirus salmonis]|uniref:SETD7 n=1 Tax=Lepeophtheirus salmonis TaxID=72036 RepID=A0A7R8D3M1_LEPSM|nr:SETD7 [Lepeophtheirus salmonis]CAF3017606.1 SETD7 [Lepeophtheirus salmonis]
MPKVMNGKKNAYKIMNLLGKDQDGKEGVIDIPEEYIALDKYKASLSHKANHSFEPNAKFTLFHHARFGLIPSLVITAEAVAHDKEITVSYDYAMDESPPWYQDLYTQKYDDFCIKNPRTLKGTPNHIFDHKIQLKQELGGVQNGMFYKHHLRHHGLNFLIEQDRIQSH